MRNNFIEGFGVFAFGIILIMLFVLEDADAAVVSSCRSATVKRHFDKQQGYPKGRKGYVVDHICPLEMGGLDSISNMQYQTIVDGKMKDRIEGTEYGKTFYCNSQNSTINRQVYNCKGTKEK